MTFIKLLTLIILCILAVKVSRVAILAIRAGHSVSAIVISPIKRLWIWEYNTCRILFKNLVYSKVDIFKTLTNKNEVGKIREHEDQPIALCEAAMVPLTMCQHAESFGAGRWCGI